MWDDFKSSCNFAFDLKGYYAIIKVLVIFAMILLYLSSMRNLIYKLSMIYRNQLCY
jgi:hypothetical protein